MSRDPQSQSVESAPDAASQELLLDLNFVPAWARGPSGKNPYAEQEYAAPRDRRDGGRPDRRAPGRGGRDRGPSGRGGPRDRDRDRGPRGARPVRDQGGGGGPPPRRDGARPDVRDRRRPPQGGREDGRDRDRRPPRRQQPDHARPAVEVRFLPDRQKLGAMVREMQDDQKAYPIMELASLFIQKPDHYLVKMEAREPREGEVAVRLYQFTPSQAVFTSRERLVQYALANHLGDHFEVEETEGPAPSGNFQCVCRCTMTGTLLGPPNYHGTQARIQQMVTTRFPRLGIEEYRTRIETIRDPELVEQWKQESRVQQRYRLKTAKQPSAHPADTPAAEPPAQEPAEPAPPPDPTPTAETDAGTGATPPGVDSPPAPAREDAAVEVPATGESAADSTPETAPDADEASDGEDPSPAMTREEARQYFLDRILPKMVREAKRAVMPATVAQRLEDPALKWLIRDAWQRENRFPLSLSLAMRPAFRHMRLHLFKVNRKQVFVTAVPPRPLDADAAIDAIQRELEFLRAHPGCTRRQLVDGLCPAEPLDSPRIAEVVGNLRWLIDKGHVIEFYNGRLSLPSAKGAGPRPQPVSPSAPTPADAPGAMETVQSVPESDSTPPTEQDEPPRATPDS